MHSCDRLGVVTSPQRVRLRGGRAVRVCPLLSMHHASFDTEPDILSLRLPKVRACTLLRANACMHVWYVSPHIPSHPFTSPTLPPLPRTLLRCAW